MAKIVEVELVAKTDGAVAGVKKVDQAIKKTGNSAKKTSKDISAFSEGGKQLVGALDRQTGGLASKFVAVGKAAKLSGKAMKTALISSGIGLAVVAIALIVENWEKITSLVDGVSSEQDKQLQTTKDTLATQQEQLAATGSMENTLKLQGKTEKEIRDIKKQQTDEIIASTELLLEQQKQQKKAQVEAAERNQNITKGIIAFLTAPIVILLGLVDGLTNSLASLGILDEGTRLTEGFLELSSAMLFDPEAVAESGDETVKATEETLRKLKNTRDGYLLKDKEAAKTAANDKKNDEIEAEKTKAAALERIRKGLIDTEAEERAEKLRLIKEDYDQQIALAAEFYGANSIKILELKAAQKLALDAQQVVFDEQDKDREAKKIADQKKYDDQVLEEQKKLNEQLADAEEGLQEAKANALRGGLDVLGKLAGKSKALSVGLLVVEKGLAIAEVITNASKSILAAKANMAAVPAIIPGTIIPNPSYAVQAAATLKGIATTKISAAASIATIAAQAIPGLGGGGGGGSRSLGGGSDGGGGAPQAPAFNVVGASGETQLADAIGSQTQRPARAYVVSNDVTTAQEMDRNIIEGASIG